MTPPVIDASVAAKWLLRDERSKSADAVLERVSHDGAFVPAIFTFEIENILIVAERRKRIDSAAVDEAIDLLKSLAFQVDPYAFLAFGRHIEIARRYMLSTYDAAYVVSAMHLRTDFFTADARLANAAREEKIATVLV